VKPTDFEGKFTGVEKIPRFGFAVTSLKWLPCLFYMQFLLFRERGWLLILALSEFRLPWNINDFRWHEQSLKVTALGSEIGTVSWLNSSSRQTKCTSSTLIRVCLCAGTPHWCVVMRYIGLTYSLAGIAHLLCTLMLRQRHAVWQSYMYISEVLCSTKENEITLLLCVKSHNIYLSLLVYNILCAIEGLQASRYIWVN
jgi:hypothetical protein